MAAEPGPTKLEGEAETLPQNAEQHHLMENAARRQVANLPIHLQNSYSVARAKNNEPPRHLSSSRSMTLFINWLLLGLVSAVYSLGVILALWPSRAPDGTRTGTRILLVCLRLAIAWHFFMEGMDKLHNPNWTSEGYLREATGPLAPTFRDLAGDRLVDRLTVTAALSFPDELDHEWENYLQAFQSYYGLNAEQANRAREVLRQAKSNSANLLATRPKQVERLSPYPPALKVSLAMPQRLEEYAALKDKVQEQEQKLLLPYGDAVEPWKAAKAGANRWRAGLQRDLASVNKEMKRALQNLLLDFAGETLPADARKKIQESLTQLRAAAEKDYAGVNPENWDELDRVKDKWAGKTAEVYRDAFFAVQQKDPEAAKNRDNLTRQVQENILESRPKERPGIDPLPLAVSQPIASWTLLDWSDVLVKYGITAVGLLLLVGLLTRTACVAGAGFLLMFYLSMPPLPGWPESPRVEGHYLFINKNVIEMLALLVLASTHSGRWAGLDGLIYFLRSGRWQRDSSAVRMERVASSDKMTR